MFGQARRPLVLLQIALDAAAIPLCFLAAFWLKKNLVLPDAALDLDAYVNMFLIEAPFVAAVFVAGGLYSPSRLSGSFGRQAWDAVRGATLAYLVFLAVSFYARLFSYSRGIFTLFFLILVPVLVLDRALLQALRGLLARATARERRVVIFSDSGSPEALARALGAGAGPRLETVLMPPEGEPVPPEALARIDQGEVAGIVIDLPPSRQEEAAEVVRRAEREGVGVCLTARALPTTHLRPRWEVVGGVPVLVLGPAELTWGQRAMKRGMDVAVSLVALVLLAPLMLFIAALVKLTSRGPAFYRQRRVGLDGREFTILKFRTMVVGAEKDTGPVWAKEGDERRTRLGAVLRRTNLDELPQLLNVLAGSMSLVGPRPERPEFVARFKEELERYAHKHWMKPGMTGWAQVHGWRGDTDLGERLRHDIYYIENWSPWLDVWILVLTLFKGFRHAV